MNPRPPANPLAMALAAGNAQAFAELYEQFGRSMLRVAVAMLGAPEPAEDVLQDVFVSFARHRQNFSKVNDIEAYVFRSLRHAVFARIAATKREQNRLHDFALLAARADLPDVPPRDDLDAALALLPAEQREVIALKIDADLTFAQIGQVLGVSLNTAASRYRYAIEKLRHTLEHQQ